MITQRGRMGKEMRGWFRKEGTLVYLWLSCVDVWQRPVQYGRAVVLQYLYFVLYFSILYNYNL